MATKFTMKAARANDIALCVDRVELKEATDKCYPGEPNKAARFQAKVVDEINEGNSEFFKAVEKKVIATNELAKTFRAKAVGKEGEELKAIDEEFRREFNKIEEKMMKELNLEELGEKEVTITIGSDDRFKFLKDIMQKVGYQYLAGYKVANEIFEALDNAKEAE